MTLGAVKHEVCACELHDQLDRCMEHVAAGNEVVVTRHGRPVALLTQPDPLADLRSRGLVQEPTGVWQPRDDRPVPTAPVSDLIAEQRR